MLVPATAPVLMPGTLAHCPGALVPVSAKVPVLVWGILAYCRGALIGAWRQLQCPSTAPEASSTALSNDSDAGCGDSITETGDPGPNADSGGSANDYIAGSSGSGDGFGLLLSDLVAPAQLRQRHARRLGCQLQRLAQDLVVLVQAPETP